MSTRALDPKAISANPEWRSLLATAGLALVIAIGVVLTLGQSDRGAGAPSPAHSVVSDAHRAKAELLAERAEERTTAQEQPDRTDAAWRQYEDYVRALAERAIKTGTGEVGGG